MFVTPRILAFGVSVFLILVSGGHVVISHCGSNLLTNNVEHLAIFLLAIHR